MSMTREQLIPYIAKWRAGDPQAAETVMEEISRRVFFICKQYYKNEADAEDASQNALLDIYQKIDSLKDDNAFFPWMTAIVNNHCKDDLRKAYRHHEAQFAEDEEGNNALDNTDFGDDLLCDSAELPEAMYEDTELRAMVNEVVESLPTQQRMAVLEYYYNELTTREIAEALNISENTVKNRLFEARKSLKKRMDEYEKSGRYKFRGTAPLPLLFLLLRRSAAELAVPASLSTVLRGLPTAAASAAVAAAAGNTAAAGTATAAGTAAGSGLLTKVIAGILAAGLLAGGVGVTVHTVQKRRAGTETVQQDEQVTPAQPEETPHVHLWLDATCTGPRTCSECKTTEGDALGHDFCEATYAHAAECSRCGEIDAPALSESITFGILSGSYDLPYAIELCDEDFTGPMDYLGVTLEASPTCHVEIVDFTVAPSDEAGYTDVSFTQITTFSASFTGDTNLGGPNEFSYRYTVPGIDAFDLRTGQVFPTRLLHGDDTFEASITLEDENGSHEISIFQHGSQLGGLSEWQEIAPGVYSAQCAGKHMTTYSYRIPNNYDGLCLYIDKDGKTKVHYPSDEEEDETEDMRGIFEPDEDGKILAADDLYCFKVSDLAGQ